MQKTRMTSLVFRQAWLIVRRSGRLTWHFERCYLAAIPYNNRTKIADAINSWKIWRRHREYVEPYPPPGTTETSDCRAWYFDLVFVRIRRGILSKRKRIQLQNVFRWLTLLTAGWWLVVVGTTQLLSFIIAVDRSISLIEVFDWRRALLVDYR